MIKFFLIFSVLFFSKYSDSRNFPEFFGCFCEGGLIIGKIRKDQEIFINKKKLNVFDDGSFIFAFGRKFDDYVSISVNGKTKKFKIKKKKI